MFILAKVLESCDRRSDAGLSHHLGQAIRIIRKINLRVHVDNLSAIHLYEKYEFVREGRRTREFYLHGQFIDVFLMGLPLDPD